MIKVSKSSNFYNDREVTEKEIVDLIGMKTYHSLFTLFPDYFSDINPPVEPSEYSIELIQYIQSTRNILPEELKKMLVTAVADPENVDPSIQILINSSPPPKEWNSTFMSNVYFILFVTFSFIILLWCIYLIWDQSWGYRYRVVFV